jgi:tetratricopeptide (TPR) repeat protein
LADAFSAEVNTIPTAVLASQAREADDRDEPYARRSSRRIIKRRRPTWILWLGVSLAVLVFVGLFAVAAVMVARTAQCQAARERGFLAYQRGDNEQARREFTTVLELAPEDAQALAFRAGAFVGLRRYDEAIADAGGALALNPNESMAFESRGAAHLGKGALDLAIADCTQALRLNPAAHSAFGNRGAAYLGKDDFDRALADLHRAIGINPMLAENFNSRGRAYYGKQDWDRAIADFAEAMRLNPSDPWYPCNRGNAYLGKGQHEAAIADCTAPSGSMRSLLMPTFFARPLTWNGAITTGPSPTAIKPFA